MKKSRALIVILCLALMLGCLAGCGTKKEYPSNPITIMVGFAAGGSVDLLNRAIAVPMEKELGVKVNVSNVQGANSGTAALEVLGKDHDGYNWFGTANGVASLAAMGAAETTVSDWTFFMIGGTTGVLSVREDSPYNTVEELLDGIRAKNGDFMMGAASAGTPWHVQAIMLGNFANAPFTFVPYGGSNPSILACLNGEVEAVLTGLSEQAEFLAAKKLRPLAMIDMNTVDVPGYGPIPSIVETVPEMADVIPNLVQFNCFALPADTDPAIIEKVTAAFKVAMQSDEIQSFCAENYITPTGIYGDEANAVAKQMESIYSWSLYDLGVAPNSPETYGIPRP